jgi:hypothetical protein
MRNLNEPYTLPVQIQAVHRSAPGFELYVPRAVNMRNQNAQKSINDAINRQVYAMLKDFGYFEQPSSISIYGFYEVKTNERGLLSISLNIYSYPEKAAHGTTVIKSLTFDIATGKVYSLGELFAPGSHYVQRISDQIQAQIAERDVPVLQPFTAIRPDQDYYVADKALVVYFQLYELTPYAYGFPMFPISVYSLESIIPENSPLQPMTIND